MAQQQVDAIMAKALHPKLSQAMTLADVKQSRDEAVDKLVMAAAAHRINLLVPTDFFARDPMVVHDTRAQAQFPRKTAAIAGQEQGLPLKLRPPWARSSGWLNPQPTTSRPACEPRELYLA